ncbi:MAG: hypothetical protein DPW18_13430 [Chloroflexi bacterium]|nr:MAG: serine/threonine protein kinase [Chloroflexota bacterium]MCQ3938034.1 hypothetical protein [Chloroflexota bacterium]MDL1943387.1 hypothetical protein [Chloroflexi bacterium CFX2]
MSIWNGKTLGKVQIGELIARGGMAEVYRGTHTLLDRKVAVKIMRDHVDEDPETRARFEREARVMANLNHPNIIQIFDYDLVDGRPCIVMELVNGASLGTFMKSLQKRGGKLSNEEISRLLVPIASAIDYAHSQNIVHRDIKPANILLRAKSGTAQTVESLSEDVEPVLTDFGLVRLLDSTVQTSTGTVSGTPAYMSPEQARGDKVDRKTDIYSLGVVLYEMVAGEVPFEAESSFGVLMKHLNDPPPPIAGIPLNLQAVINRALAKDPAHRYDSAGDLVQDFIAVCSGQTVSADTKAHLEEMTQAGQKEQKPEKRRTFPTALAAAGALLLTITAGILIFGFLRPAPALNPNKPIGLVSHQDFNGYLDKVLVSVGGLPAPKPGEHYEVWYLAQGGEIRRNIGRIAAGEASEQLSFISPDAKNLLGSFDQVEVTIEPDNDPHPDEPSGQVAASSVFPPFALVHVRHLLVASENAPEGAPLAQGLWTTIDNIDTSVYELNEAYKDGDEETFRLKIEEIINQIVGNGNAELYQDWNGDSTISDPGDGYGFLTSSGGTDTGYADQGGEQGYAVQTISHAEFAAGAPDATENIKIHSGHVIVCVRNIEGWSKQMLELAIRLMDMPFGPEMEPALAEIQTLSYNMLYGVDTNNNGVIEPVTGEGGADTVYEHAYYLAEMPLLPGAQRTPPSAPMNAAP